MLRPSGITQMHSCQAGLTRPVTCCGRAHDDVNAASHCGSGARAQVLSGNASARLCSSYDSSGSRTPCTVMKLV